MPSPVAPAPVRELSVPIIDIAPLARDPVDPAVVDALARACRDWGFFQIVGHGESGDRLRAVWEATRAFFALPIERKRLLSRSADNPWGFYDRELTKNRQDQKEVFDFTLEASGGGSPFAGANQWPADQPRFRKALLGWFEACGAISARLLAAIVAGLGLPRSALAAAHAPAHTSFMRLNYYPLRADAAADDPLLGIHPHSDAGTLTVLLQDDVPGLEVERDGAWYPVAPARGALVINIGDMLQVWSNDHYRAPLHRVQPSRNRVRYSIPFFYNPSYEATVAPLPALTGDSPPHYHPFTWGEFRRRRADGDFADYGAEVQIADYRRRPGSEPAR